MEASTTIKKMLAGNKISVPTYQRAYSWDTGTNPPKQVNVFLSDLEEYNKSGTKSKYYFGHFLFEEKEENLLNIIDGQQRLTTVVIFLSALFSRLKNIRALTIKEIVLFQNIIKLDGEYNFETVDYDSQFFKDYVVDQISKSIYVFETESAKRIAAAFDFFTNQFQLADKDESYLVKMLDTVQNASCTTHIVKNEAEAIQMFIFQNNRGKKPSNLEIIKAQFMFTVHLYGGEEKDGIIKELKNRFEKIYKSISSIEYRINEDDILLYTLRVYFNSLAESNAIEKINQLLLGENQISFIREFTQSLTASFEYLTLFFGKNEKENLEIHSLITLGGIGIAMPFIIKAYSFGLSITEINLLCSNLESIILRHRVIGTRADIIPRLNDVYQHFTSEKPQIQPIIDRIIWMKTTTDWWWSYWGNNELGRAIQGVINHTIAKYLLWKYENHLKSQGKSGYKPMRFDEIISPELEHIAPQTENPEKGYDAYDGVFKNEYLDCIGNYLLISKSHNCAIGNKPFVDKRNSYNHLEQQREIQKLTAQNPVWTKQLIDERKRKIIDFLLKNI